MSSSDIQYTYVSHLNVKTYLIDCLDLRIGIGRLRSTQVVLTSLWGLNHVQVNCGLKVNYNVVFEFLSTTIYFIYAILFLTIHY